MLMMLLYAVVLAAAVLAVAIAVHQPTRDAVSTTASGFWRNFPKVALCWAFLAAIVFAVACGAFGVTNTIDFAKAKIASPMVDSFTKGFGSIFSGSAAAAQTPPSTPSGTNRAREHYVLLEVWDPNNGAPINKGGKVLVYDYNGSNATPAPQLIQSVPTGTSYKVPVVFGHTFTFVPVGINGKDEIGSKKSHTYTGWIEGQPPLVQLVLDPARAQEGGVQ